MEETPNTSPLKLFFGVIVVLLAFIVIYALINTYTDYLRNPDQSTVTDPIDDELRAQIESVVADAAPEVQDQLRNEIENAVKMQQSKSAPPFEYTLVPGALDLVTVPPPPDSTESDQIAYEALFTDEELQQLTSTTSRPVLKYDENDTTFDFFFEDGFWGEYIDSLSGPDYQGISQVYDELGDLTYHLDLEYNRPALHERIDEAFETTYNDIDVREKTFIYPSFRAVEGFATGEMMARIDPQSAELYRDEAEEFVERGMVYGLYGASDIEAARSVVNQYFALLDAGERTPDILLPNKE